MRLYGFGRAPIATLDYSKPTMAELITTVDRHRKYCYPKPIVCGSRVVAGIKSLAQQMVLLPPGSSVSVLSVSIDEAEEEALRAIEQQGDEGTGKAECARALVEMLLPSVQEQHPELRVEGQGGRTPSARGIARGWASDILGIMPETVARYDYTVSPARAPKPDFVLQDWGLPYSQELLDTALQWRAALKQAIEAQRGVVKALSGTPWQDEARARLEDLEDRMPEAICPYCKAWGWLKSQCEECGGTGIAGKHCLAMSAVFVRLWNTEQYWGRTKDKEWVSLDDVRQEP